MNLKKFNKFRSKNNLLFGFQLTNENVIVPISTDPDKKPLERGYTDDEVQKYRTRRYNSQRTGSVISKLKIDL